MNTLEDDVCPICLEDLEDTNGVRADCVIIQLGCSHSFHRKCITEWCDQKTISTSATCPLCRENISPFWKNQKPYCKGITKKNRPCKNLAKFNNKGYCWIHKKFELPPRVARSSSLHQGNTFEIFQERQQVGQQAQRAEAKRNNNNACIIL